MLEVVGVRGRVRFDGATVEITKRVYTQGTPVTRIPLGQVTGVQLQPAGFLRKGYLLVDFPGAWTPGPAYAQRPGEKRNGLWFKRGQQPAFEELARALTAALAGLQRSA